MYIWKVFLLAAASAVTAEPSRALSLVYKPHRTVMFIPKNYRRRRSRVLFLDEDENHQPFGRGEIDLTDKKYSKIKFDDTTDYEFTSPEDTTEPGPSENERFYEPPTRFRPFQNQPLYYQGRYTRPYAPAYSFGNHQLPAVRNGYYPGWRARSPRVVFPYATDSVNVQTNSHSGPIDNVVFRDQNFGLNDVNDETLQDIGTGSGDGFNDRDAHPPHRVRNKQKSLEKPMFIQMEATNLMAKRNDFLFPNITDKVKELPKFKPITDQQIMRVNEILRDLPIRNGRRGRLINHDTNAKDPNMAKFDSNNANTIKNNVKLAAISTNSAVDGFDSANLAVINANLATSDVNFATINANLAASDTNSVNLVENENTVLKDNKLKFKPELDRRDGFCPQGGTCEFFFYCWMVGGLLDGTCGGLLKGCCHRVAKAGVLGVHDSNSIEYSPNEGSSYGPVINDESKSSEYYRIVKIYLVVTLSIVFYYANYYFIRSYFIKL